MSVCFSLNDESECDLKSDASYADRVPIDLQDKQNNGLFIKKEFKANKAQSP